MALSRIRLPAVVCAMIPLVVGVLGPSGASAQGSNGGDWLTIRPFFYMSNTDGRVWLGQSGANLEMEDTVLVRDWAVQADARIGRFALLVEAATSRTSDVADIHPGAVPIPYSFKLFTVEAFAGYRIGDAEDIAELMVLTGARFLAADQGLGTENTAIEDTWVTPVFGVQGRARAADRLSVFARTDAGVRFSRKSVTWELRLGMDLDIWRSFGLAAQYRFLALNQPFKFGDDFAFDGSSQGWLLGAKLGF